MALHLIDPLPELVGLFGSRLLVSLLRPLPFLHQVVCHFFTVGRGDRNLGWSSKDMVAAILKYCFFIL